MDLGTEAGVNPSVLCLDKEYMARIIDIAMLSCPAARKVILLSPILCCAPKPV